MLAKDITLEKIVDIFQIYERTIGEIPSYVKPSEVHELIKEALNNPEDWERKWRLSEGYRVGSLWSPHSKLKFPIEHDGSLHPWFSPNMDPDDPMIKEAKKAARKFEEEITRYLAGISSTAE